MTTQSTISDTRLSELIDYATNYGELSIEEIKDDIKRDLAKALVELAEVRLASEVND